MLRTFRNAASRIPFYRSLLDKLTLNSKNVRNIRDFRELVPILDKDRLYTENLRNIGRMITPGALAKCESIFPSSGFSGKFSFGMISKGGAASGGKKLYNALNWLFGIAAKRTLIINALSMGISITVPKAVMINTGLRSDIVISAIRTFSGSFDQMILIGENAFIKKILEEGSGDGLDWANVNIHVVFGGESFPESYRTYLEEILGITPSKKTDSLVGASFGFAESGLNIMSETRKSVSIRKKAYKDKNFLRELAGDDTSVLPVFMQYDPFRMYVEEHNGRLLFTDLSGRSPLPIIRYMTGDEGSIIPYKKAKKVFKKHGVEASLPDHGLPLVALRCRADHLAVGDKKIYPDAVKDAIYSHPDLAKLVTGYFRMRKTAAPVFIDIQLKERVGLSEDLNDRFMNALKQNIDTGVELKLYPYASFPYAMELDYEKKFRYI